MKDNKQNMADLIGALAEDIEEIKKKLDAKDSPDKDEAQKRLEAKLEPVISFFNGNAPENINAIFGSKEDRKSTRLNSSHITRSRMPSSA